LYCWIGTPPLTGNPSIALLHAKSGELNRKKRASHEGSRFKPVSANHISSLDGCTAT
jgi:hypothetical protein